eukprot:305378-Amphidinium_carterae.4
MCVMMRLCIQNLGDLNPDWLYAWFHAAPRKRGGVLLYFSIPGSQGSSKRGQKRVIVPSRVSVGVMVPIMYAKPVLDAEVIASGYP